MPSALATSLSNTSQSNTPPAQSATATGMAAPGQSALAAALTPGTPANSTLQGSAQAAGLPATMGTPATAASIGASPDAAKMAGTPASQAAQIALPNQPQQQTGNTLAQTDATQATNQSITSQSDQQQAARLEQDFGSVGVKVNALVNQAVANANTSAATSAGSVYSVSDLSQNPQIAALPAAQQQAIQTSLQALAANPSDPGALQNAYTALGAAGINPTAVTNGSGVTGPLALLTANTTGQAASNAVGTTITLTPAVMSQIGITPSELTDLGLDPSNAANITVDQLQSAMQAANAKYQQNSVLQATAAGQGGYISAEDQRGLQTTVAQTAGGAGATTEAGLTSATNKALDGTSVTIGGQDYTLDQLLTPTNFGSLVAAYQQAGAGSALQQQIDAMMPSFGQFVSAISSGVASTTAAAQGASAQASATATANAQTVQNITQNTGLNATQIAALLPSLANASGGTDISKIDTSSGIAQSLISPSSLGTTYSASDWAQQLQSLQSSNPDAYAALSKLTPAQLAASGLLPNSGNPQTATNWNNFTTAVTQASALQNSSPSQVLQTIYGTSDVNQLADTAAKQAALGDASLMNSLKSLGVLNEDGSLASASQMATAMQGALSQNSLSNIMKQVASGQQVQTLAQQYGNNTTESAGVQAVAAALSPNAINQQGQITLQGAQSIDVNSIVQGGSAAIQALASQANQGNQLPGVSAALASAVQQAQTQFTTQQMTAIPQYSSLNSQLQNFISNPLYAAALSSLPPGQMPNYISTPADTAAAEAAVTQLSGLLSGAATGGKVDPSLNAGQIQTAINALNAQLNANPTTATGTPVTPTATPSVNGGPNNAKSLGSALSQSMQGGSQPVNLGSTTAQAGSALSSALKSL